MDPGLLREADHFEAEGMTRSACVEEALRLPIRQGPRSPVAVRNRTTGGKTSPGAHKPAPAHPGVPSIGRRSSTPATSPLPAHGRSEPGEEEAHDAPRAAAQLAFEPPDARRARAFSDHSESENALLVFALSRFRTGKQRPSRVGTSSRWNVVPLGLGPVGTSFR